MESTYTAVAIYEGCEIGFGEGESYGYAVAECLQTIDSFYRLVMSEIEVTTRMNGGMSITVSYALAKKAARQYL